MFILYIYKKKKKKEYVYTVIGRALKKTIRSGYLCLATCLCYAPHQVKENHKGDYHSSMSPRDKQTFLDVTIHFFAVCLYEESCPLILDLTGV